MKPKRRGGGSSVEIEWSREEGVGEESREVFYQISGSVSPYDPGVCSGPVERCYPPEGGEVEIEKVELLDDSRGKVVRDVTDENPFDAKELEKIEERLTEQAIDSYDDGDDYDPREDRDDRDY
jgi:hypothetical protein